MKLEGDLLYTTEQAEKFIEFLLSGRSILTRKPTTLKLEGDMEIKTESMEKFVPFEYQKRPPLYKKDTNLHLEGSLDLLTEKSEKYVPYELKGRCPLTKHDSNLHLEGDLQMLPEYRDVFVEYKLERLKPCVPHNNLKPEGLFDLHTETTSKYLKHQIHPTIPFLRGLDHSNRITLGDDCTVQIPEYKETFVEHVDAQKSLLWKPEEHLKQEGSMQTITENRNQFIEKAVSKTEMRKAQNNLLLEGRIDMNPEYRNVYVDFHRDPKLVSHGRSRKTSQSSNFKSEGDIEINPEYKSSYIDFPRERPHLRRPEGQLFNKGDVCNAMLL